MPDSPKFPYTLENVLLVSVECKRAPQVPENLQTVYNAQIGVGDIDPEHLQVLLNCETGPDAPVFFKLQVVGTLRLVDGETRPPNEQVADYAVANTFPLLWQHISQIILELTARMGMNPIRLNMPPIPTARTPEGAATQQTPPAQ